MVALTQQDVRIKFAHYYLDLSAEMQREGEGATVDKSTEWDIFIAHLIEEGSITPSAKAWPCPQSLSSILQTTRPAF